MNPVASELGFANINTIDMMKKNRVINFFILAIILLLFIILSMLLDIEEYCKNCRLTKFRPFHDIDFDRGKWGVYFIKCGQYVKIGKTLDIDKRIDEIKRNNPFDLSILLFLDHLNERIEPAFHKYFADNRYVREWFYYEPNIIKFVKKPIHRIKRITYKIVFELTSRDFEYEPVDED